LRSGTPVLILPGYGDSGPDHWQSHWERADPRFRRVIQDDWLLPKLADWMARLEKEVAACVAPPVLAAHSLACSLVAHWAIRPGARAAGALLVAPADVDSPAHTADEVRNFSPVPLAPCRSPASSWPVRTIPSSRRPGLPRSPAPGEAGSSPSSAPAT
jgi:uncharacterized protein